MSHPGSDAWRHNHWGAPCQPKLIGVTVGSCAFKVDRRIAPATEALDATFAAHGYRPDPPDTGSYNCRHVGGDPSRIWSAHAWAIAIDFDWQENVDGSTLRGPIAQHQERTGMVDDVEKIATVDGVSVWRWGGDWDRDERTDHSYYDPMHFEIIATPTQLARGIDWTTVPRGGGTMLKKDDKGNSVALYQRALLAWAERTGKLAGVQPDKSGSLWQRALHWGADGDFGGTTVEMVEAYQKAADLPVTGSLDGVTTSNLVRYLDNAALVQVRGRDTVYQVIGKFLHPLGSPKEAVLVAGVDWRARVDKLDTVPSGYTIGFPTGSGSGGEVPEHTHTYSPKGHRHDDRYITQGTFDAHENNTDAHHA